MNFCLWVSLFILCFCMAMPVNSSASPYLAETHYGANSDYTDNVDDEYDSEPIEMVLMEKPVSLQGPNLHDRIFNSELSNEFRRRYEDQFGKTEQEENYYLINKQGYYESPTGLTATQTDSARRDFAEYMMKRLIEYHAEAIMKEDPVFRKVYAIKQAVTNFSIAPGGPAGGRLDVRYSFIGNYMVASYTHPIVNSYLAVNMDPSALTPTSPREILLNLHKDLTLRNSAELGYYFYQQSMRALFTRKLTPTVSANISEVLPLIAGYQFDSSREGITLVGLSVIF